ncbi:MAG: transglutaminase-like domain-containing protein [Bacteroides sp.]|nr:transglutaminase-like domain-containing protein [Eubacterium sp.]MCM1418092.1 transglutaminase-like domain-containing protein [Roseburia sp.]MCM1462236.1 transglutaminase-like domain-containing protein [Bacteroides sp.]
MTVLTDFFKRNTIPMLLFVSLCSSVVYIYASSDFSVVALFTVVSAVYATLLFALYEKLKALGKTAITTIAVAALMILSVVAGSRFFETDWAQTTEWVLEPQNMRQIYAGNIAALLTIGGFILGSALYYFTSIRYRAVFVFLICMCPFSLFAKTFTEIPVIYIILIATLFFILMILKASGESAFLGTKSYLAFGAFVAAVVSAAAFLPKLESAPYREDFDELITGIRIGGASGMDFNGFSDSSSYSGSDDDETVFFTIYGDNPIHMKRQCFNLYRRETDQWEYYGESDTGYNNFDEYINWEDPAALSAEVGIETESELKGAWIRSERGKLRALYTTENMTVIEVADSSPRELYRTPMDEYFISSGSNDYRYYRIEWSDAPYSEEFSESYTDEAARENAENDHGAGYYKAYTEMKALYAYLLREDTRREAYKSDADHQRVRELAETLTEGLLTDHQKAKAIEAYLLGPEFVYDNSFAPADGSVENFLFRTRRGACADYATAMTLLCREVGLYSRYVEGFLVQKKSERGNYYVTAADSHAYVQVWINGYGWTDFDPTSNNIDGGYVDYTFAIFGAVVLLAALSVGLTLLIRPAVRERMFLSRAKKLSGREQILTLYPRLSRFLHLKLGQKKAIYTPRELKERAALVYGVDLAPLADNFERAAYGGKEADALDYPSLYGSAIRAVKAAEKERRKKPRLPKK